MKNEIYEEYNIGDMVDDYYNNNNKMEYKFSKGVKKGALGFIIFALPIAFANFPDWANLTLGSLGIMLVNYLKVQYSQL